MAGCSFGGIETVLAAERGFGFRAAVDFAGGAMSWEHSSALRERMVEAVKKARMPIFFLQAENDFDTRPSLVLSDEMTRANKPHEMKIYPAVGTTHEEGHGFCKGGTSPAWGPDVEAFLKKHLN